MQRLWRGAPLFFRGSAGDTAALAHAKARILKITGARPGAPRRPGRPHLRAAQPRPRPPGRRRRPALEQHYGYGHDALPRQQTLLARLPEIGGVESAVVWPGRPYGLQVMLKDAGSVYWMVSGASGVAPAAGEDERLAPQPMPELGGGRVATAQVEQALLTALAAADTRRPGHPRRPLQHPPHPSGRRHVPPTPKRTGYARTPGDTPAHPPGGSRPTRT